MIFSYNPQAVGDVLLIVVADAANQEVTAEKRGNIARVFIKETNQTVGINFFNASHLLENLSGQGQVYLNKEQVQKLNELLAAEGFCEKVQLDNQPDFVTGFVKSCKKHPDSNHLSITQTDIGNGELLQIVCGAPNIKAGLKVVVARVGAMMPNGLIIWPGKLRGEESHGMICSAKELGVPDAPTKKGIMELPFDTEIGQAYSV